MIGLLVTMFVGIIVLVELGGIVPEHSQTVLSQLAHQDFGSGPLYVYVQAATALVLLLAAETAYNDFPRVMFLMARDLFAPRPFLKMGDRLAFDNGILALSIVAGLAFFAFNGNTNLLIPLYAVGVFLAFTLSQAGMVVHWWRLRSGRWRRSILFTAVALLTRRHFDRVAAATGLSPDASASEENEETPSQFSNLAIVPVPYLNRVTMRALAYAVSLGQPVLALHVSPTEEEAKRFREYWVDWGNHVPLEVVKSPQPRGHSTHGRVHRGASRSAPRAHIDSHHPRARPSPLVAAPALRGRRDETPPFAGRTSKSPRHKRPAPRLTTITQTE
jgi:Amino acid permease